MNSHPEEQKEETLATPGVLDKYQAAGKITNFVLEQVLQKIKPGAKIIEICDFGDKLIQSELAKAYTKKKVEKGPAFPTCISINEICGHYSPLLSDSEDKEKDNSLLKEGDVVKIDLGTHIDGFIALGAHTVVCQDNQQVTKGRKADVILAAYKALQATLRTLKPGGKNNDSTQVINKVIESYKCNALEGVLSHELKKYMIDGNNVIINKETFDQKVDDHEFNVNEVYAIDIIVSSGEGKAKETELRTTVYKRALERSYNLKTKHGRAFIYEINEKYPALCFSLRNFEDEITTKLGVAECLKHDLLNNYPVLTEKKGEFVAQFKYTVAIMPKQIVTVAGLGLDEQLFESQYQITDETIKQLLDTPITKKAAAAKK
ncbi:hypothetical protein IMG5_170920 [Ichthyophthirius multifiliis]|uniref:Peptidase M24 domain-containing protein n=1 Tax=Ichthyophthirius multifiliis TaxID=5932 RepID=G0R1J7_ICHMU|nr:hypothetical protein IMG5_170920 [Ichthyophthirius multifiliis]EGR28670.1 hypothetical protein IMG5_170920 [Ichthyophthirius multifiliis]|eukprot:XP_004029906.1 hypothetical protein IMG5_170920 [Ichthyophthirius multifiliis]